MPLMVTISKSFRGVCRPAAALASLLAGTAVAVADDLCVSCAGPAAVYRCQIDPASGLSTGASDPRAQLLCITELAKQGKHESCAVDRAASGVCPGQLRTVSSNAQLPMVNPRPAAVPDAAQRSAAPATQAATQAPSAQGDVPAAAQPSEKASANGAPKTVEELVAKSSLEPPTGLQQAGKTIAKTADSAGAAVTDTAKAAGEAFTDTAKTAGDAVGKAGSAVGGAAKKSWDCVTSLFSKC